MNRILYVIYYYKLIDFFLEYFILIILFLNERKIKI